MFRMNQSFLLAVLLAACSDENHDHSSPDSAPAPGGAIQSADKPYPLDRCVVSGEKLGSMGAPTRIVHEGQEIKFCCPGCRKDFNKDPQKFLKLIAEAQPHGKHEDHP